MKNTYSGLEAVFEKFLAGELTDAALKPHTAPYGIYQQRNGNFMVRIRINGGQLDVGTFAGVADVLEAAGGGHAHLTSRQDIQLHDVPPAGVVGAVRVSHRLGLPFKGGGGDTYRNTVVGEDSGLSEASVFDVYPYASAFHRAMLRCEKAFKLPRKLKIGFFASERDRLRAAVQDLGFLAQMRDGEPGFTVYVAGGMGRESALGIELFDFLPASQAVRVAVALAELFHDHGDRVNRHQARLRFLLKRLGAEAFLRLFLGYFARTTASEIRVRAEDPYPDWVAGLARGSAADPVSERFALWEKMAVLPTRFGPDVCSVRLFVPHGNLSGGQIRMIAALTADCGSPQVRLLTTQDLLIPLVHRSVLSALYGRLRRELAEIDLTFESYRGHVVTCVGASVCKIGMVDAPAVGDAIAGELDLYLPADTAEKLRLFRRVADGLRISGCPNSCSGHPAVSIGVECCKRQEDGEIKVFGTLFTETTSGVETKVQLSERLSGGPSPVAQLAKDVVTLIRK